MTEPKKKIKIPVESDSDTQEPELESPVQENNPEAPETDAPDKTEASVDYLDQLQRLQAEFTNYRKRTDREKETLGNFVRGSFIQTLIPVIDDLDLMLQHHEKDKVIPFEGITMIVQKFHKILTDQGLETIDALGEVFNPELHEALAVQETDNPDEDDIIIEEWQKGYQFHEQLIRPSRVKVNRYVEKTEETE